MPFPWFLFGSLLMHAVLAGVLIFFVNVAPQTPLPISRPVLKASLWVQPQVRAAVGRPKHLISDAAALAKNMQGSQLKGAFAGVRTRVLGQRGIGIADVLYLDSWKRKVERVGNLNYPAEARRLGLSGSLRLRVLLNRDGGIAEVTLLSSSGEAILDKAALKIVHLAAPFAPFPPALRREVDVLEIVRTWRFLGSREVVM